ncbi:MFS transporter [Streptomyces sp. NPDC050433]|uniref:MFS transporter n=1 Tax=Streptomyces sp. NPDC050433 TaxID=3365615 RepID=UPI0037ADCFDE
MTVTTAEPTTPGMSLQYLRGRPWRTYALLYALALAALSAVWSGVSGIVLPNHIQDLAFHAWFTGGDAHVDLQQLNDLKTAIEKGSVSATPEQTRLLRLLSQFDATRTTAAGVINAVAVIFVAFAQPIAGVLSDRTRSRFGRRAPWIFFGAVTGAVTMALVPLAPNLAVLGLLWVAVSVFFNVAQAPLNTTVADRIPEELRGRASSAGGMGNFLGGLAGAVGAAALYSTLGFAVYPVFAAVTVAFLVMFVMILRDRSSLDLSVPRRDARKTVAGFLVPLRNRDFRWVWTARVLLMFGYTVSSALNFFMLQSYVQPALSQSQATTLTPMLAMAGLPGTLVAIALAGRLSDRIGRRKPFVVVASVLMAASMLAPLVSPTLPALFVQTILTGFAFGIYLPVDQALFVEVLPDPENAAGRDLGVAALATNVGQALGPVLAGQVVALSGSYRLVWPVACALVGIAALAILPVKGAR